MYIEGKETNNHARTRTGIPDVEQREDCSDRCKQRNVAVITKLVQNADGETATKFAMDSVEEESMIYVNESRV